MPALQKGGSRCSRRVKTGCARWRRRRSASCRPCVYWVRDTRPVFYVGLVLAILVALLLSAQLSLALATAMRRYLRSGASSRRRARRRQPDSGAAAASASVAALMLSLALVVAFAGMSRASYDWMRRVDANGATTKLFVMPSPEHRGQDHTVPRVDGAGGGGDSRRRARADGAGRARHVPQQAGDVSVVDSIAQTARLRSRLPETPTTCIGGPRRARASWCPTTSRNCSTSRSARSTRFADQSSAWNRRHRRGLLDEQETILMDRSLLVSTGATISWNVFHVYSKPGAKNWLTCGSDSRNGVRTAAGVRADKNGELKRYILKITDQWFGLTSVQIAVAVLVAILGVVNTLTVSFPIGGGTGMLQAVGALHGHQRCRLARGAQRRSACCSASRWAPSTCTASSRSCITISPACSSTMNSR